MLVYSLFTVLARSSLVNYFFGIGITPPPTTHHPAILHGGVMMCGSVPVYQVWSVLRGYLLCCVAFWNSHVNDSSLVVRMDQLVSPSPLPVSSVFFSSSSVYPANKTRDRDPEQEGDKDNRADNIVFEELENGADADVINEIPYSHNVLVCFLTMAFVTKSLEAGSPIRKNVYRCHSVTGTIKISSTASFTGIGTTITHTRLLALGLTEWNTFSLLALSLLNTVRPIRHAVRLGTVGAHSGTLSLLLAGGVVRCPTLGIYCHVLTQVAAGGVLITADAVVP